MQSLFHLDMTLEMMFHNKIQSFYTLQNSLLRATFNFLPLFLFEGKPIWETKESFKFHYFNTALDKKLLNFVETDQDFFTFGTLGDRNFVQLLEVVPIDLIIICWKDSSGWILNADRNKNVKFTDELICIHQLHTKFIFPLIFFYLCGRRFQTKLQYIVYFIMKAMFKHSTWPVVVYIMQLI